MNNNGKITALWISILFVVLVASAGWVFGFMNMSAADKIKEYDAIILEWKEDKGMMVNELKNINKRLDRIERLIETNNGKNL
jgi:Tfp pilus assembly protein PilO